MYLCLTPRHRDRRAINLAADEDLGSSQEQANSIRASIPGQSPRNECQLYPAGLSSVAVNTDKGN